jgi:transcriptional regulator with XRE-family HTH domain
VSKQVEEALQALGARLRGFRKDAGFTSGRAFARATSWQESKVSRIENGKQRPSEDDIRVWCEATGQGEQLGDLVAIVRHVDELWLEWRRQLRTGVEKRQRQAIPVYARTKVFRIWHPTLIWGTLQTAEYAGDRVFNVLLGEQALYTNFGGSEVMKGQLDRLLAVMRLPRLSLGIVPKSAPTFIWPGNAFSMFDSRLVLVETYSAELSVTQPREIELYTKAFALLKQSAVYGTAVRDLISTAIQHFDQMPTD